jgi:hypothetical protein
MKFISTLDQLSDLVAQGATDTILIGGDLVFITHNKEELDAIAGDSDGEASYIIQPRRLATRARLFDKTRAYLYVAIDARATDILESYPGQVAFLVDHYLAYGLTQKTPTIVVGGCSAEMGMETNVEILVFNNNTLIDSFEKSVQISSYQVDMMMAEVVSQYPDYAIHWCNPLDVPPICALTSREGFQDVGDAPFKSIIKRKLFLKSQGADEPLYILPAAGIVALGFTIFAGVAGMGWLSLERERALYHSEIQGFEDAYLNSRASLEMLRHRDFLLRQGPGNDAIVNKLERVLFGAARINNVVINEVQVYSASSSDDSIQRLAENFMINLSVPKPDGAPDTSAREVGEPIVHRLSELTGYGVRLLAHNAQTLSGDGGASRDFWQYRFGGFDDAPQQ